MFPLTILDDKNSTLLRGFSCETELLKALNQIWLVERFRDKMFVGSLKVIPNGNGLRLELVITTADGTLGRLTNIYEQFSHFTKENLILLNGIEELRQACAQEKNLVTELWDKKQEVTHLVLATCQMDHIKYSDGPNQLVVVPKNNQIFVVHRGSVDCLAKWHFEVEPTYVEYRLDELLKRGLVDINDAAINFRMEELENTMANPFRTSHRLANVFDILKEHKKEIKEKLPEEWKEWNSLRVLKYKRDPSSVKDLLRYMKKSEVFDWMVIP